MNVHTSTETITWSDIDWPVVSDRVLKLQLLIAKAKHRCRVYSHELWTLQWLEPSAGKLARSGLRGRDGSDAVLLPDDNKVVKGNALIRVGCWGHVMVKFKDAYKVQAKLKLKKNTLTAQAIKIIKALYKIEDEADAREFNTGQRQILRQVKSKPILKKLHKWLDKHLPVVVKQSALGKVMHYMDSEWETLLFYLTDGRLRIDNNLCENAIRPFVIDRKNHLFSDTVSGAKASANLYSLVETVKANGLEPYAYLKHVFTELPKATCVEDIEALLPFKPVAELEQVA